MRMSIKRQVLQKAIELLERPGAWARNALAYDEEGEICEPTSSEARQWCAIGAIEKIAGELGFNDRKTATVISDLCVLCTGKKNGLSVVNDEQGYEQIMLCLRMGLRETEVASVQVARPVRWPAAHRKWEATTDAVLH
jgi:hypothetical protein